MSKDPHAEDDPRHEDAVIHDDQAHAGEALGPIDVPRWGAGVAGVLLGLVVAYAFVLATNPI